MRKVIMIMFGTIDGVAEFPVYESNPTDDEDPMWEPRMADIDTIILGSRAYKAWSEHWPARKDASDAGPWEKKFASYADAATKVVFSKTLKEATWGPSVIARGDPAEEVAKLRELPGKHMALGGGPRIAQSFLKAGLVDEMVLMIMPSILGKGKPLFRVDADPDHSENFVPAGTPGRQDFRLVEAKPMKDWTVFLHYARP